MDKVKKTVEYQAVADMQARGCVVAAALLLKTPWANLETSKRKWELAVAQWRQAIRDFLVPFVQIRALVQWTSKL